MTRGKVKWWDRKKGFGFITTDAGVDVFVHHAEVLGEGLRELREEEEVEFEIIEGEKGPKATKVRRLTDNTPPNPQK